MICSWSPVSLSMSKPIGTVGGVKYSFIIQCMLLSLEITVYWLVLIIPLLMAQLYRSMLVAGFQDQLCKLCVCVEVVRM
jgi:hypothetical protein